MHDFSKDDRLTRWTLRFMKLVFFVWLAASAAITAKLMGAW